MKKLLPILFILAGLHASAQYGMRVKSAFSAGLELGIPQNSIYSIGPGISAKAELPIVDNIGLSLTGGYTNFFYKGNLYQSSLTPSPAGFIPLKAGIKYYFNQGVYVESEAGAVIETNYQRQGLFAFAVGPGFVLPVNDKHSFDFGFRYETWSHHQVRQTAIRFAYRF